MYSIVLMAALTTGGEVADRGRCGGYSTCYSSCYSYCYRPCYSYCYTPCYTTYYRCAPVIIVPAKPEKKKGSGKDGSDEVGALDSNQATIVVNLPADATLTIDGTPTTSTSARRVFISPELDQGKEYHYMLKATVMRDGKPVDVEKKVSVRAGEQSQVTLTVPEVSSAD